MNSLAFSANLQPRLATLRILISGRVQSYLPRQTELVYIAIPLVGARMRALMFNRKGCESSAAECYTVRQPVSSDHGEVAERLKAAVC